MCALRAAQCFLCAQYFSWALKAVGITRVLSELLSASCVPSISDVHSKLYRYTGLGLGYGTNFEGYGVGLCLRG